MQVKLSQILPLTHGIAKTHHIPTNISFLELPSSETVANFCELNIPKDKVIALIQYHQNKQVFKCG